ncbi:MAG: DEAD/DEAH box helicase [Actinomycetaceae bacterium]|nr:DEAD/DEAH box helicase [Actinomycetaceae bacterium]
MTELTALERTLATMNDDDIIALVGPATYGQGLTSYERNDVISLEFNESRDRMIAKVRGAGMTYTCWFGQAGNRVRDLELTCACTTGVYCKHAIAALWKARTEVRRPEESWRTLLTPFLHVAVEGQPLALVLETAGNQFSLSPRRAGARGKWVSQRASWADLTSTQWASVTDGIRSDHLTVVRSIWNQSRRSMTWHSPNTVPLSSLGAQALELLLHAQQSGVQLLLNPGERELTVNPAPLSFHLAHDVTDSGADLTVVLTDGKNEYSRYALLDMTPPLALLQETLSPIAPGNEAMLDVAIKHRRIHVPTEDLSDFYMNYAPQMGECIDVHARPLDGPHLIGTVSSDGDELVIKWSVAYRSEQSQTLLPVDDALVRWRQDRSVITSVLRRISQACEPYIPAAAVGRSDRLRGDAIPEFLNRARAVETTIDELEWVFDEEVNQIAVSHAPMTIEASAIDIDDPDWFDLKLTITVGGEQIPIKDVILAVAAGRTWVCSPEGVWVQIDSEQIETLLSIIAEQGADDDGDLIRLPGKRMGVLNQLEDLGAELSGTSPWLDRFRTLTAVDEVRELPQPHGTTLRDYQRAGVAWLDTVTSHGFGAILADDMGLGKTLQILTLIQAKKDRGELTKGVLVCAPTSVVSTWVNEAHRFFPDLSIEHVRGSSKKREYQVEELLETHDIIVTSWTLLRLDADEYGQLELDGAIFDEAQAMKNPATHQNQAARNLGAQWAIAATGTPIENTVTDLWAIMNVVNPGLLPGLKRFNHHYRRPIETDGDHRTLERLHKLTEPFMRRRTKDLVATELPDKIEQTISIELDPAHQRAYDRYLNDQRGRVLGLLENPRENATSILAALTKLRMLALDPALINADWEGGDSAKTQLLVDHLISLTGRGHRALVFSQFTSYLKRLARAVNDAGITSTYLDGTTRNRDHVIARFKEGDAQVFLISLKAGGTGLTLTEADYVYVMDPWWNPAVETQAIDRAHRIGQQKTVNVYRLCAANTIEHKVMALQEHKRSIVDRVMTSTTQLSTSELADLLS